MNANFNTTLSAPFTYFESTVTVPPVPSAEWKTLLFASKLVPIEEGENFSALGRGILAIALTYGDSCAPNPTNVTELPDQWWVSAQYQNSNTTDTKKNGCYGGQRMAVSAGDRLRMVMAKKENSSIWEQQVFNLATNEHVNYTMDLKGQGQYNAVLSMDALHGWYVDVPTIEVKNIYMKTAKADAEQCKFSANTFINTTSIPRQVSISCTDTINIGHMCGVASCKFYPSDVSNLVDTNVTISADLTNHTSPTEIAISPSFLDTTTLTTSESTSSASATATDAPLTTVVVTVTSFSSITSTVTSTSSATGTSSTAKATSTNAADAVFNLIDDATTEEEVAATSSVSTSESIASPSGRPSGTINIGDKPNGDSFIGSFMRLF